MKKYNVRIYIEEANEEDWEWCDLGNHQTLKVFDTEEEAQEWISIIIF